MKCLHMIPVAVFALASTSFAHAFDERCEQHQVDFSSEFAATDNRKLIWQISRAELPPSYLFGTIHVGDPEVIDTFSSVDILMRQSRRVVLESALTENSLKEYQAAIFADTGDRVRDLLDPLAYANYEALVESLGIDTRVAAALKPWAAYNLLVRDPDATAPTLDEVIAARAGDLDIEVVGLESMTEITGHLDRVGDPANLALLTDLMCNPGYVQALHTATLDRYMGGGLEAIFAFDTTSSASAEIAQPLQEEMVTARNPIFLERMLPWLDEGGAFVAVGASHLAGDDGLVARLRDAGYQLDLMPGFGNTVE